MRFTAARLLMLLGVFVLITPATARGQERLCDPSFENCRVPLIELIRNETAGIDVAFWFMTDLRYVHELILKWNAGVPVRVLMDRRANEGQPANAELLQRLREAGIPMREKVGGGILHWKMMLFKGQNTVQFSGANYSGFAFTNVEPYVNYVDEVIYFTGDPVVVGSFMTKYDDVWTSTSGYANYANVTTPLARSHPTFPIDPELNFPPGGSSQDFSNRSVSRYNAETLGIDAIIYRITDRRHTDALINAHARGVPIRIITEPEQYRDPTRPWHSWNVDRLHLAGVQVRHRAHLGLTHQKLTLLHGQTLSILGSSNWTSPSANSQLEHNYFTTKRWIYDWSVAQFNRKWSNTTGHQETAPFVPLPPDQPVYQSPAFDAQEQPTTVTLRWYGGPWAHLYDIYVGTDPASLQLESANLDLGPSTSSTTFQTYTLRNLVPGTTYYWRIVSKTMAHVTRQGPLWNFRTGGAPPPPPPPDPSCDPLPDGWARSDVGLVTVAGATCYTTVTSTYAISGAGADIWDTADEFHFAYRQMTGNGTITARVTMLQHQHAWTKAGVMMRETLAANARHAMMVVSATRGLAFQRRVTTGGQSLSTSGTGAAAPHWVRLVRSGSTFTAYTSSNGSTWTLVGSETIAMASTIFVGLPITSHHVGTLATATLDNVQVSSTTTPPPPPSLPSGWSTGDVGASSPAGSATHASGTFTIRGAGADIWGTADAFHFTYRQMTGDGTITARVATLQQAHVWTKAGVMMRETLAANARHAMVVVSAARGVAFQRRVTPGGESLNTSGTSATAPHWVRLVRSGNTFTAYSSANGSIWTLVGTDTMAMASTIYVGLPITSHSVGVLATTTIDQVQFSTTAASPPPAPALPDGWSAAGIGAVNPAGSAAHSGGTFTIRGAGADIWDTADAFHFTYRQMTGDGTITARVATLQQAHVWTKAGVMMRSTLAAGSPHAMMVVSAARGLAFQRRLATGGESTHTAGAMAAAPHWVRLVRSGNTFTAYASANGSTWTLVGSDTIPMTATIYVGLPITSHADGSLATGTVDSVTVTP